MPADVRVAGNELRRRADLVESAVEQDAGTVGGSDLTRGVQRELAGDVSLRLHVGKQQVERAERNVVRRLVHEVANQRHTHRIVVPPAASVTANNCRSVHD